MLDFHENSDLTKQALVEPSFWFREIDFAKIISRNTFRKVILGKRAEFFIKNVVKKRNFAELSPKKAFCENSTHASCY